MRRVALILALGLGAACGSGDDRTYSYFQVAVKVDRATVPEDLLDLVAFCHVEATTPRGMDTSDLRCQRRAIPYDLGTFEYSTTLTQGTVGFRVLLKGINANLLAQGESAPLDILAGRVTDITVEVKGVPGAMREPMTVPVTP